MRETIEETSAAGPKRVAVFLVAIALVSLGPIAVFAPSVAAQGYGVPLTSPEARVYLLAAALRDVAMGLLLLALVGIQARPRIVAASLFAIALIAAGDAAIVVSHSGLHNRALAVHLTGFIGLLALGGWFSSPPRGRGASRSDRPTGP